MRQYTSGTEGARHTETQVAPGPSNLNSYRLVSLGCKVNQYEGEQLRQALEKLGLCEPVGSQHPDVCIVNTCTVTARSDRHCRQLIHRLHRQHPGASILVTGCYARTSPEELARLSGVTLVSAEKARLLQELAQRVPKPHELATLGPINHFSRHTRAFLKVQDGCQSFCHYCIIPYVRPRLLSKPIDEATQEASTLYRNGHPEIVLVGIHLGQYGADLPEKPTLAELLKALLQKTDVRRLRLSSIEVTEVTSKLLELMSGSPRICPHLHLPLQSGSESVLNRMGRRYTPGCFLDKVRQIRALFDHPAITTDVMVGFPGETEEEFESTVTFCREVGFSRMHIFPYSPRPMTRACGFPERVPAQVIARRKSALRSVAAELSCDFQNQFIGKTLEVLVESKPAKPGMVAGLSPRYLRVCFPGDPGLVGQLIQVQATRLENGLLAGKMEPASRSSHAAPRVG